MARINDHDYELLSAYLDGVLTTAERSALDARLQAEPELRRELESLRGTVNMIRALPPIKAPRDYTLDERQIRPARLWIFPSSAAFSAISAAAATLLVVLGLMTLLSSNAPKSAQSAGAPQLAAIQVTVLPTNAQETESNTAAIPPALTLEGFSANDAQLKMDATLATMSEAQAASSTAMQRQTAPGALAIPALPQPQGSPPPPSAMGGAEPATGNADLFFGAESPLPEMTEAADAILMQAAQPTLTETQPPTSTVTPSATPTGTPQPTVTPVPASSSPAGPSATGTVMVIGGVALLALAIATSLVRRRRA